MPKYSRSSSTIVELGDDYAVIEEVLIRDPNGTYMPLLDEVETITHRYKTARKPWHTLSEHSETMN